VFFRFSPKFLKSLGRSTLKLSLWPSKKHPGNTGFQSGNAGIVKIILDQGFVLLIATSFRPSVDLLCALPAVRVGVPP
jgi:hypothetical protein